MARRRRSGGGAGVVVGVGTALVAATVVGFIVAKSNTAQAAAPAAPPALPPVVPGVTPPSPVSLTLQAGHRYSIAQLAPVPGMSLATPEQAQVMFDALFPGAIKVVSITPAAGGQPATVVFDNLRTVPLVVPTTMPVTDLGASPAIQSPLPGAAPAIPLPGLLPL